MGKISHPDRWKGQNARFLGCSLWFRLSIGMTWTFALAVRKSPARDCEGRVPPWTVALSGNLAGRDIGVKVD